VEESGWDFLQVNDATSLTERGAPAYETIVARLTRCSVSVPVDSMWKAVTEHWIRYCTSVFSPELVSFACFIYFRKGS
jgi:hypothetical protein